MIRMSTRAPSDISLFLAVGCTLCLAVPAIVVTAGVLGLDAVIGHRDAVSQLWKDVDGLQSGAHRRPAVDLPASTAIAIPCRGRCAGLKVALGAVAFAILARAFYIQVIKADDIAVRASLVQQADGTVRYQYNYRLLQIARRIPRGNHL
jgi:hypothetical protein